MGPLLPLLGYKSGAAAGVTSYPAVVRSASTFGSSILPALDQVRAISGALGLRPFRVYVRVRVSTGNRPGQGSQYVDNGGGPDVQITNGFPPLGPQPVQVKMVSNKDIIASAGLYRDRDMIVGPITPPYPAGALPGGGFGDPTIDPTAPALAAGIYWNIIGPGMAPNTGSWFVKIGEDVSALHYYVTLRATGTQP